MEDASRKSTISVEDEVSKYVFVPISEWCLSTPEGIHH